MSTFWTWSLLELKNWGCVTFFISRWKPFRKLQTVSLENSEVWLHSDKISKPGIIIGNIIFTCHLIIRLRARNIVALDCHPHPVHGSSCWPRVVTIFVIHCVYPFISCFQYSLSLVNGLFRCFHPAAFLPLSFRFICRFEIGCHLFATCDT
jgi:hypothetical protein